MIMLNSMGEGVVGEARSFFVTVPESRGLEEVAYLLGGEEEVVENSSSLLGGIQDNQEVFLEDSGVCDINDSTLVCFTSVAREEVVVGQEDPIPKSKEESSQGKGVKTGKGSAGVHCDLCNSLLPTEEEALEHMRSDHHIVTFEGAFKNIVSIRILLLFMIITELEDQGLFECLVTLVHFQGLFSNATSVD